MVDLKTVAFTNLSKLRIICSLSPPGYPRDPFLTNPRDIFGLYPCSTNTARGSYSVKISPSVAKQVLHALPREHRFDEVNASSDDENNGYGSDRGDGASSSDEDEADVAVDAIPSSEPQEVYNADADVHDLASKYTQHQYMLHSHPNLGHLEIDGELQGFEKDLLVSFLTTSGSLKIFKCPETDSFGNKEVPAALTKTGVFLEEPHSYDFLLGTNSIDLNIAVTVFRHPRLKTI
ncbi:hypothetical protein MVEG_09601 [Podila verticillata NRRL 6337]|nr:hypothetical protein MVEG_09601 [Podila verticillata NRRL 6337]